MKSPSKIFIHRSNMVTSGWLEDRVHENDAEVEKSLVAEVKQVVSEIQHDMRLPDYRLLHCQRHGLPPVFILKTGDEQILIWPNPPQIASDMLLLFCLQEHQSAIVKKFCIHLNHHPEIPLNNKEGIHLTAKEIYYKYCYRNNLSQVWAYLWN
jgi:hypothetical protein